MLLKGKYWQQDVLKAPKVKVLIIENEPYVVEVKLILILFHRIIYNTSYLLTDYMFHI